MKSTVIFTVTPVSLDSHLPLMSPMKESNITSVMSWPGGRKRVSSAASPILLTRGQLTGLLDPNMLLKKPPLDWAALGFAELDWGGGVLLLGGVSSPLQAPRARPASSRAAGRVARCG